MMIVLKRGAGHQTITQDVKSEAMRLFAEGYTFWQNEGVGEAIVLGNPVKPEDITDEMSVAALARQAGG